MQRWGRGRRAKKKTAGDRVGNRHRYREKRGRGTKKDPQQVQQETNHPNKRGRDRSDPSMAHEAVPGWMRIQWAHATGLLAARWGINTG